MDFQDNQSLSQLCGEIRNLRCELQVLYQQQTQIHQLIQQQQTQFHQLITLLLYKNSTINLYDVPVSIARPPSSFTSYPDQSLPALDTPTPLNTPSSIGTPNLSFASSNKDPYIEILRPEASYPNLTGVINQDRSGRRPSPVGGAIKTVIPKDKRKRAKITTKEDEAKEKEAVEDNQNSNSTTLKFLQIGNRSA